jgi:hypothetical protein
VELAVASGQLVAFRLAAGQLGPVEPESLFAARAIGGVRPAVLPAARRAG